MPYIEDSSADFGGQVDDTLTQGSQKAAAQADGTLAGSFKAQGTMTETVIQAGSIAATNASFNQGAQVKKRSPLADAGGLLHRMGDDDDRIAPAQFVDQFLDPRSGDRIERRARLVHQDNFGADRDGAGDAQPLLLAARERGARFG